MTEVLIEMHRQGAYLKCTAIDPETGEEAIAVGPAKAPDEDAQRHGRSGTEGRAREQAQ